MGELKFIVGLHFIKLLVLDEMKKLMKYVSIIFPYNRLNLPLCPLAKVQIEFKAN